MNIVITGATSGIGKQLALDYAAAGHHVVACGRNQEALQQLQQRFEQQIASLCFDVTDKAQTIQQLATLTDVDCVILCAGVCEYLDVERFDSDMFERVYRVNVFGMMHCVEAILPNLKAGSRLVLVGSSARLVPFTRAQVYGSSKAAIDYISRSLEVDLKARGVRVQSVSPGFVETPMTDANDFEMPMRVSVDKASKAIRRGIEKNKTDIAFPTFFALFLKFIARLPASWQVAISKRLA